MALRESDHPCSTWNAQVPTGRITSNSYNATRSIARLNGVVLFTEGNRRAFR